MFALVYQHHVSEVCILQQTTKAIERLIIIIIIIIIIITYLARVSPSAEAVINGCPGKLTTNN